MKRFIGPLSIVVPYVLLGEFVQSGGEFVLAFPWIAAAGIAVSAVGSLLGSKSAGQTTGKVSGKKLFRQAGKFLPKFRELEAGGAIPGFQSAAATQVARRGLTGTGLGVAIQGAAGGAGELFALRQAFELARGIQFANAGFADNTPNTPSALGTLFSAAGQGFSQLAPSGTNVQPNRNLAPNPFPIGPGRDGNPIG